MRENKQANNNKSNKTQTKTCSWFKRSPVWTLEVHSLKYEYIKVYTPNHLGWEIGCGRKKKKDLGMSNDFASLVFKMSLATVKS